MNLLLLVAGIASMRDAITHHDVDEAIRQGTLAGAATVAQALASPDRTTQLAGIAAAPRVEDRAELLTPLAKLAGGTDRRTALPAALAARTIARELGKRDPDDLAPVDFARWHDAYLALAQRPDRWIELRVAALDAAAALGDVSLSTDQDPALRIAAIELQPAPVPAGLRADLAKIVITDIDDRVALAAATILCADLASDPPGPILDALGPDGIARLRKLPSNRDVQRCLR